MEKQKERVEQLRDLLQQKQHSLKELLQAEHDRLLAKKALDAAVDRLHCVRLQISFINDKIDQMDDE